MQSTRALAMPLTQSLRMQSVNQAARLRPTQLLQQARGFRSTARALKPMPKEEHSAHTISQRIRTLKKIPPELIPLGIVLAVAIGAAGYSLIRKFYVDGTLRLYRSRGHNQASKPEDTKSYN